MLIGKIVYVSNDTEQNRSCDLADTLDTDQIFVPFQLGTFIGDGSVQLANALIQAAYLSDNHLQFDLHQLIERQTQHLIELLLARQSLLGQVDPARRKNV